MPFGWFDLNWAWTGLAASAGLFVLLFLTDVFRADLGRSRWFDPVWLGLYGDAGAIRPIVSARRRLEETAAIHAEGGARFGNIAIAVDEASAR